MVCRYIHLPKDQSGMTLIEMTMAMMILLMFTGSVVMVMQFTTTFMAESDQDLVCDADVDPDTCSKGLLIDHADLQIAMDELVAVLEQPAINVSPYAAAVGPSNASCTRFPFKKRPEGWQLPGRELHSPKSTPPRFLPPDYKFCLWRTLSRPESPLQNLISGLPNASPGIYILQAVPAKLSPSSLPTRRLFCRPKPFC